MKKNAVSTILLCALLLASCGGGTSADTTAGGDSSADTANAYNDDLPADLDLQGQEVGISVGNYNNAYFTDLYSETETGNRLDDAVYAVRKEVEERLNVKLAYTSEDFKWEGIPTYKNKIIGNIMADDDSIDLVIGAISFAGSVQDDQYFANLADTPYIDLDKPWYIKSITENMPTDYIYFTAGSFALTNIKYNFGMFFNDTLKKTMNINEDLYALVDEGKWTLDAMNRLIANTYIDLNGDTAASPEDQYGLAFGGMTYALGFMPALEVNMFVKEGDRYNFTYDNDRAVSAVQKLCEIVHENSNVYPAKQNNDASHAAGVGGTFISKIFIEGRSVFTCDTLANAPAILGDIKFDYGLLPYPKWDEAQKNYQSRLQRSGYALIPVSADIEPASAVLEALGSASHRRLVPEYCEVTLKTRYAQDDNVSRMYDLILSNIVYDPGEIFSDLLGGPSAQFYEVIFRNEPNWASKVASMKENLQNLMDSIVKAG